MFIIFACNILEYATNDFAEELSEYSDGESEDDMSVDEAKSQIDSEIEEAEEDEEEYDTITVSEAPDERYDQNIDTIEESESMEKLKRMFGELLLTLYSFS